jgi:hypothetical protein
MKEIRHETLGGLKCFDENLKCRDFQFEVGKTYELYGEIKMCEHGFHFHHQPQDLFTYYSNSSKTRVCEVVAHDVIAGDNKAVCRRIEVVRELSLFEICRAAFSNGDGDGYGYGDGYGNGYGYGYGDGYGDGDGNGDGDGDGNGDGYGDGYGDGNGDGDGDGNGDGYGNGKYGPIPDFIDFEEQAA